MTEPVVGHVERAAAAVVAILQPLVVLRLLKKGSTSS